MKTWRWAGCRSKQNVLRCLVPHLRRARCDVLEHTVHSFLQRVLFVYPTETNRRKQTDGNKPTETKKKTDGFKETNTITYNVQGYTDR